ncbi:MAG: lamin tail domain-containing protein [Chloroflexota bacterium]|nr:lamin tail domain-containing protein [Chloroflexota bacterium]
MHKDRPRPERALPSLLLTVFLLALVASCGPSSSPSASSGTQGSPGDRGVTTNGGSTGGAGGAVVTNPGGAIPILANKPAVPDNTYQGCPSSGDGGDPQLNVRKDRTDTASWYPVSIASVLNLQWPKGIERTQRANWSSADAGEIAKYEGTPVQIEGWLAGAKQEGPESCNCHSVNDVDNHLWIVDTPNGDRSRSVVVEVTPRIRAQHPGWAFERIRPLVDGQTKVRISGWLLMDQEHPDQIGKTRGTIWEIHPIVNFEVQRGNNWISLDTGRVSSTNSPGSDAAPTEDPNLPPPIVDPMQNTGVPTARPRPPRGSSGGRSSSNGAVEIDDIFYNGTKGSSEPDEYVEIANVSQQAVNMDGWVLHDIYGTQEFTWHGFTLQGQHKIRVYTNEVHPESGGFSFGSPSAIWGNKGDAAELIDSSGVVVASFSYGDKK